MCVGASVNLSKAQAVEGPYRHKAYRLVTECLWSMSEWSGLRAVSEFGVV